MRSIAYLLLANFRLKQKMEKSNVSFPSPKVPSIWREVPLFSSSKVIVTEKGISASGNWIFYSKTGGKFNCSVVHTNTGWVDGLIFGTFTCVYFRRGNKMYFWHHFISFCQLAKSDKTVGRSSLTLRMQIEDRLKSVGENIKPKILYMYKKEKRCFEWERQMWDIGWHASSKYSKYLHLQMYPERWNHLAYSFGEVFQHWNKIFNKTKVFFSEEKFAKVVIQYADIQRGKWCNGGRES